MKKTILLPIILVWSIPVALTGQYEDHQHPYDHHHRHHEIAVGTGAVYMPGENSWGYGIHLHALTGLTEWMGTGLGYELIVGEHTHHTITGLLHFHPFHPLDINVGPGLVMPDKENPDYRFKLHTEIAAVFEINEHFHLGPSLDTGIGRHDIHITLGMHAGWVFGFKE